MSTSRNPARRRVCCEALFFFSDVSDHLNKRTTAARTLRSFDLVLSSHLLFMYADRLDEQFHAAAAREMVRVAEHEARIFPLISEPGTDTAPLIKALLRSVEAAGCSTAIRPSAYECQRGGNEMSIINPLGR